MAGRTDASGVLSFGVEAMDSRLGGGLLLGALHEVAGASSKINDDAAALLFIAGITARVSAYPVLWALRWRDLFAPGLAQAGLTPDRLIQAECRRDEDVLAVMEEGLRHGGLAAVVGEVGQVPMAATRRLQLAAEQSGTMALMLRKWRKNGAEPLVQPSCAVTRWTVGCVPSAELPVPGVGRPRWNIHLVRQRGGEPHHWIMEGSDAEGRLALPAGPSHRSAAADRGGVRQAA
ncbi:protein ImuA [Sphingomonas piscis]|uniref:Protein ImuA n=1 Tax=Sphingomonas piscis TaxID=2714943 RepID=A0A6G7YT57_9SPHN|nr:protein ImuA [Sphingomonas piscis]QIK79919.1 protein ImuA [Sphingomonas piscis]